MHAYNTEIIHKHAITEMIESPNLFLHLRIICVLYFKRKYRLNQLLPAHLFHFCFNHSLNWLLTNFSKKCLNVFKHG